MLSEVRSCKCHGLPMWKAGKRGAHQQWRCRVVAQERIWTDRLCSIEGCDMRERARSWCSKHYQRWKVHGDPTFSKAGEYGAPRLNNQGYIQIGQRLQHRLMMEEHLGRSLSLDETVHHKNGVKTDNRIENLELWSSDHPYGQRVTDLLEWAHEIIKKYESYVPQ